MKTLKSMKLGNDIFFLIILFFSSSISISEDRIVTTPLINLGELKPSFEETDSLTDEPAVDESIKNKKKVLKKNNVSTVHFIGLDKITAKTSNIIINLGETKKFGPLEIKVLKCGVINLENKDDNVAYLQVKDLSENENEKVFIFNGWTFSSDPTIAPFDHAIYDLQLVTCNNV